MKIYKILSSVLICFIALQVTYSQNDQGSTIQSWSENDGEAYTGSLLIGGYGEIHFNQPLEKGTQLNGNLDVHRLVLLLGYNFDSNVSFFSEIEFEHVKELFVEQAFLQYHFSSAFNIKAGLLLIPMGIVNEYHEPPLFFGVERSLTDNLIVPSTWREIGAGFSGNLSGLAMKYQLYLVNGLLGYDGSALFNGSKGLRGGRQKGAKSIMSSPDLTGKITWYGVPGLKLGASIYTGRSESTLYSGLDIKNKLDKERADSSSIYTTIVGFDLRYAKKAFQFNAQLNYIKNNNVDQYNTFANSDLGESLMGYYLEVGYDLFKTTNLKKKLVVFTRYESVNTQYSIPDGQPDTSNKRYVVTTGLNFALNQGAVIKGDFQVPVGNSADKFRKQLNLGVGVWFR